MLAEPTVPRRTSDDDESLAAFVTRRFGREALEVFGEPLLAGIYVGRPARQSMQATFPQLVALERRYGSVTTGLRQPTATPPPPAELPAGLFLSLAGGLGELIDHLASRLTGPVRLNQPVVALEPDRRLRLASGECLRPDAILLTTPPAVAGRLLAGIRPDLAATLARLPTVSSGTISLGFRAAAIDHPLDGYGFLVPRREPTRLLASTWSSTKLPGRAPTGHVLLRLFVGGHRHAADLRLPDDQLLALARTELARIMGITAQPVVSRIFRWRQANPQYELGHLATMAGLRQQTPPWLALAGCAYEGIGIPDCIRQGRTAAAQLLI
jgi:oxygen-dependent protoporphyrinogen oxidase